MQNFTLSGHDIAVNTEFWKQNSEEGWVKCVEQTTKWGCDNFAGWPFYIFSFVKRIDDVSGVKKMYHQARLTKPDPVPGSTLLRIRPDRPGDAYIIWTLPNEENFGLYKHGKLFGDPIVYDSVQRFLRNPTDMTRPETGDASENVAREIYKDIRMGRIRDKKNPQEGFVQTNEA